MARQIEIKNGPENRGIIKYFRIKKLKNTELESKWSELLKTQAAVIINHSQTRELIEKNQNTIDQLVKTQRELESKKKAVEDTLLNVIDKIQISESAGDSNISQKKAESRAKTLEVYKTKSEIQITEIDTVLDNINIILPDLKEKQTKLENDRNAFEKQAADLLIQQESLQKSGAKFADDDFAEANVEAEKRRVAEKYIEVKCLGQTSDDWLFMLSTPDEYKGDIFVHVGPPDVEVGGNLAKKTTP